MKLKTVILTVGIVGAGFLFTGCSSKQGAILSMNEDEKSCIDFLTKKNLSQNVCSLVKDNKVEFITGVGDNSMFTHTKYNNSSSAVMQMAAQYTLDKKHSFFAIAYPDKMSNFGGSLINTPEEFFKKCDIHAGNVLAFNFDPCGVHYNKRVGQIAIVTYSVQPNNVLTFDANYIMKYLKSNNRYSEDLKLKKQFYLE